MQINKLGGGLMPTWLAIVPSIVSALVEFLKLCLEMYKSKNGDQIKQCSAEIAAARASGDVTKLTALIEKMSKGKSCL
jgi:hypothetical protein